MTTLIQRLFLAICLLTWTELCSSKSFKIIRKKSKDYFTIPSSKCGENDCRAVFNATKDKKPNCECVCDTTFTFHKGYNWSCIGNAETRNLFGCARKTFFEQETNSASKIIYLKSGSQNELSLMGDRDCVANSTSSWYIDCQGKQVSFLPKQLFYIIKKGYDEQQCLEVKLPKDDPLTVNLTGRVINLGITCTLPSSAKEHSCLLFKLEGETECPVIVPETTKTFVAMTDAAAKPIVTVTESAQRSISSRSPSEVLDGPSSAADQKGDGGTSRLSAGLIAGISCCLILILIIGLLVYRRKYSRKQTHKRHTGHKDQVGQTSQSGFQFGEENAGYATLSNRESASYSSNYKVPNGATSNNTLSGARIPITNTASTEGQYEYISNESLQKDAPFGTGKCPVYNNVKALSTETSEGPYEYVPTEDYQRVTPLGGMAQPVYNILEPLSTDTTNAPYEYVPTEEHLKKAPPSELEQPVYNNLEPLGFDTTEGPYEYVPTEEFQDKTPLGAFEQREYHLVEALTTGHTHGMSGYGPDKTVNDRISVEQRVYSLIEDFCAGNYQGEPQDSVYNVLKKPLPDGAGGVDRHGVSDEQDQLYNVLYRGPSSKANRQL